MDDDPNCVGAAFFFKGIAPDGYYDPQKVFTYFEETDRKEEAVFAVTLFDWLPDKPWVGHVVEYPPNDEGMVRHRPACGEEICLEHINTALGKEYPTKRKALLRPRPDTKPPYNFENP